MGIIRDELEVDDPLGLLTGCKQHKLRQIIRGIAMHTTRKVSIQGRVGSQQTLLLKKYEKLAFEQCRNFDALDRESDESAEAEESESDSPSAAQCQLLPK